MQTTIKITTKDVRDVIEVWEHCIRKDCNKIMGEFMIMRRRNERPVLRQYPSYGIHEKNSLKFQFLRSINNIYDFSGTCSSLEQDRP